MGEITIRPIYSSVKHIASTFNLIGCHTKFGDLKFFARKYERVAKSTILQKALQKSAMIFDHQARLVISFNEETETVTVRDTAGVNEKHISFQEAMPINVSTMKGVLSLEEWWAKHIRK